MCFIIDEAAKVGTRSEFFVFEGIEMMESIDGVVAEVKKGFDFVAQNFEVVPMDALGSGIFEFFPMGNLFKNGDFVLLECLLPGYGDEGARHKKFTLKGVFCPLKEDEKVVVVGEFDYELKEAANFDLLEKDWGEFGC